MISHPMSADSPVDMVYKNNLKLMYTMIIIFVKFNILETFYKQSLNKNMVSVRILNKFYCFFIYYIIIKQKRRLIKMSKSKIVEARLK